jgi:integrase
LESYDTLALTTALRRGELLALEWKHVDWNTGTIDVLQSLPNSMLEELREYYLHKMKERDKMGERGHGGDYLFMFCHPERLRSCIKISRFSQQLTN